MVMPISMDESGNSLMHQFGIPEHFLYLITG
jgi:hypothetical protein